MEENVKCADLVTRCLQGTKISDCKDFMKSENWNRNLAAEKVEPHIAVTLLKKFGFDTRTVQVNEVGKTLNTIQDVSTWVDDLKKNSKSKS